MKKKLVILLLCTMMAVTAAGCGNDGKDGAVTEGTEVVEGTETQGEETVTAASSAFLDLKGSDYVELCDYDAMELSITGEYEVGEGAEKEYFAQMYEQNGPFYTEDSSKKTIGEGDIVDVDYVGKLDGEAFDGGSAEHQLIDVYNNSSANGVNSYIEGFTEGLKGASVGDVIDCDVTFPEDYGNADLAGKEVVFTFTVNSIQKEMAVDEVDNDFAKEQFQVETVEEMYAQIRTYLEQLANYNKQKDSYIAAQKYLLENCKVDLPVEYLDARVADYKRQIVEQKCDGDEAKLEEYASMYYGKSAEEMEAEWREDMTEAISIELIVDAIAQELEMTADEDGFTTYAEGMAANGGFGTTDILYQVYGYGDAAYGEAYLKKLFLYEDALNKIVEKAKINVTAPEEAQSTESTENTETENTKSTESNAEAENTED